MISKRIVLHFPARLIDKPIVNKLIREYDLDFNILKASVTPKEEGIMVIELSGQEADYDKAVNYLKDIGLRIQPLSQDIIRNESRCSHCGVCVPICPTNAFTRDAKTQEVKFDNSKCIACGMCIRVCPPKAMEEHF